ncbi:ubiquitin-conjugating enzyme E2, putative, partial [Plasmodium ovale curtisi]
DIINALHGQTFFEYPHFAFEIFFEGNKPVLNTSCGSSCQEKWDFITANGEEDSEGSGEGSGEESGEESEGINGEQVRESKGGENGDVHGEDDNMNGEDDNVNGEDDNVNGEYDNLNGEDDNVNGTETNAKTGEAREILSLFDSFCFSLTLLLAMGETAPFTMCRFDSSQKCYVPTTLYQCSQNKHNFSKEKMSSQSHIKGRINPMGIHVCAKMCNTKANFSTRPFVYIFLKRCQSSLQRKSSNNGVSVAVHTSQEKDAQKSIKKRSQILSGTERSSEKRSQIRSGSTTKKHLKELHNG